MMFYPKDLNPGDIVTPNDVYDLLILKTYMVGEGMISVSYWNITLNEKVELWFNLGKDYGPYGWKVKHHVQESSSGTSPAWYDQK